MAVENAVGLGRYNVGWGRKVRQGRMWLDVVGEGRTGENPVYDGSRKQRRMG